MHKAGIIHSTPASPLGSYDECDGLPVFSDYDCSP